MSVVEISEKQAKALEEVVQSVYNDLVNYKNEERKILFNVENMYYQIKFLMYNKEKWANLVIKNDKLQRIEATTEDKEGDSLF